MSTLRWTLGLMVLCALLVLTAFAAEKQQAKPKWTGSIRVEGKHTQNDLKRLAKITAPEAARTALAAVSGKPEDKKVLETELEVEHGFLVYSSEVQVKGQKGVYEVLVDAGNGKVLAQEIEDDEDDEDDDEDDEDDDEDDEDDD